MPKKAICPNCGYVTDDLGELLHHAGAGESEGQYHHICPKCKTLAFHFSASPEIAQRARAEGLRYMSEIHVTWACPNCRARYQAPAMDFSSLPIPQGWEDDHYYSCIDDGIGLRSKGRGYEVFLASLSLEEWAEQGNLFYGNLRERGADEMAQEWWGNDWGALCTEMEAALAQKDAEFDQAVRQFILEKQEQAREKGYKPGWVWFQVKDKFGAEIANQYLPKS